MRTADRLSSKNSVAMTLENGEIAPIVMKFRIRRELAALLTAFLLFATASGQSAELEKWTIDQVLAKVTEANGGQDTIDNVTNVRINGSIEGGTNSYDFVLLKKRPDKIRMRFMFRGMAVESGYDGKTGWRRQSKGERSQVTELEGMDLAALQQESDFDGPLVGEIQNKVSLELDRIERIGRVDYFVVKEESTLRTAEHYIDSRTFRTMKLVSSRKVASGESRTSESNYRDYKKYGGIWVAHLVIRTLPDGNEETIRIDQVEVNPGILDLVFRKPD